MTALLLIALLAGGAVVAWYAWRRLKGRDPLGPPLEGRLPDTPRTLVVALAGAIAWALLHAAVGMAFPRAAFEDLGGDAAVVFVYVLVNVVTAFALLRLAPRDERRPRLGGAQRVLAGVLAAVALFAVQGAITSAIQAIYDSAGLTVPQQDTVQFARSVGGGRAALVGIAAVLLAPYAEEVYFRGVLLPAAIHVTNPARGLVLQALCFGAIHCAGDWTTWPLAIPLAVVGWLAGWLYLRTGSLDSSIVMHMTFNAINFAALRAGLAG